MESQSARRVFDAERLSRLVDTLRERGYRVVAPTIRDEAIVYEEIDDVDELPFGWTEVQEAGSYRLRQTGEAAYFGFTVGPDSWKRFFFPKRRKLVSVDRSGGDWDIREEAIPEISYAFLGVRACELRAIQIQDRVFMEGAYVDPYYRKARASSLVIAVNCSTAAPTCFCASMNTGPQVENGADLVLNEFFENGRHAFVAEALSEKGEDILSALPSAPASETERAVPERQRDDAVQLQTRSLDPEGARSVLASNPESPHWDEVADRCLTCANCTMVCPTCFCSTVEDVTDLRGENAERWRRWDSCFTMAFSWMGGGSARRTNRARYRQWLTHKLSSWWDQFGESGCVGCGRCITWCPVGIDLTEEVRAFEGGKNHEDT